MCEWFQNYTQWHGLEAASLGTCSHVAVKDVPHVSVKVFLGPKAVYFSQLCLQRWEIFRLAHWPRICPIASLWSTASSQNHLACSLLI